MGPMVFVTRASRAMPFGYLNRRAGYNCQDHRYGIVLVAHIVLIELRGPCPPSKPGPWVTLGHPRSR